MKIVFALISVCLSACASHSDNHSDYSDTPEGKIKKGSFYWPYAALAADVYDERQINKPKLQLAWNSPWLREKIDAMKGVDSDVIIRSAIAQDDSSGDSAQQRLRKAVEEICRATPDLVDATLASDDVALRVMDRRCKAKEKADKERDFRLEQNISEASAVNFREKEKANCTFQDGKEPAVPVQAAIDEYKWHPVPEFQKYAPARGWRVFVPELVIDVWRRERRDDENRVELEYAIVYRGTSGAGGWISNVRAVTAVTPLVWDQYRQALEATRQIVEQIQVLKREADYILAQKSSSVFITAVGHSLGAGLAMHSYLQIPQITRVVGFDPTPFDGSALVRPDERALVMTEGPYRECFRDGGNEGDSQSCAEEVRNLEINRISHVEPGERRSLASTERRAIVKPRVVDTFMTEEQVPVYLLYEKGEAISRFWQCRSGALWGSEGGPQIKCEDVNHANQHSWFRQHSMSQLACNLYNDHISQLQHGDKQNSSGQLVRQ